MASGMQFEAHENGSPRWLGRRLFGLDWPTFAAGADEISRQVTASGFQPDVILGIVRGGLPLATVLGHRLPGRVETMTVTRNSSDELYAARGTEAVAHATPHPTAGARVLIVDDIAGDGGTLRAARELVRRAGAAEARAAVLVVNQGCTAIPEYSVWSVDDWVVFPWERPAAAGQAIEPLTLSGGAAAAVGGQPRG